MSEPCVISLPFGGLGNQLFIYAFCKALAERNGVGMRVNMVSGFEYDPTYQRQFLLDRLMPQLEISDRIESRDFLLGRQLRSLERRINRWLPIEKRWIIKESCTAYDQKFHDIKVNRATVFHGVWQDYRYFDDLDMKALIRFPEPLIKPLEVEVAEIHASNAVCLAVRRYEEVRGKGPRILDQQYFAQAMARIEQEVDNPHYFVFAQDMEWARQNISSQHPVTYARERDPHDGVIQDLYLMAQCKHFILSNSTLHFWAAWLGQGEQGKVIAPAKGWPNPHMKLPDNWIQHD